MVTLEFILMSWLLGSAGVLAQTDFTFSDAPEFLLDTRPYFGPFFADVTLPSGSGRTAFSDSAEFSLDTRPYFGPFFVNPIPPLGSSRSSSADSVDFAVDTRPYFGPFATASIEDSALFTVDTRGSPSFLAFVEIQVNQEDVQFVLIAPGLAEGTSVLESTKDLSDASGWVREEIRSVTQRPSGEVEVRIPIPGENRFYRLRR